MNDPIMVRFLAIAIMMPLIIPMALILIPTWRYSFSTICAVAACITLVIILCNYGIYKIWGASFTAIWAAGSVVPLLCTLLFTFFCNFRDRRLFFVMVTISVNSSLCDILTSIFASRSHPHWLVAKFCIVALDLLLLCLFARKPFFKMLDSTRTKWGQFTIIPLALSCYMVFYYYSAFTNQDAPIAPFSALLLCLTVILIYRGLYQFQQTTLEEAEGRQYNALLRSEMEALQRQTDLAQESSTNMHIFRHDLRHYISMLQGCLHTQALEEAQAILSHMEENIQATSQWNTLRRYTGHLILDTVLTRAADLAQKQKVELMVKVSLPPTLRVDMTELCVVISNALENAITAAAKVPPDQNRLVSVQSLPCRQQFFLVICNSYMGPLVLNEKSGLPSTDTPGHGYGTHSMAGFAQKYNCLLDFTQQGNMVCLRLLI